MIDSVVREFGIVPIQAEPLGNAGGFSGASIWRITSSLDQRYCLKRWPVSFRDRQRLDWIHRVQIFAAANGCPEIVKPLQTTSAATVIDQHDSFWELTPWIESTTTLQENANDESIESTLTVVAKFHQATARYHFNFAKSTNATTVVDKLGSLESSLSDIAQRIPANSVYLTRQEFERFRRQASVVSSQLLSELQRLAANMFPVQPVIRDLRAEHIFMNRHSVEAVIDFGAMQIDSAACDLSRLFSSLEIFDVESLRGLYERYSKVRYMGIAPVAQTQLEQDLLVQLVRATPVASVTNWLSWLFLEQREFESPQEIYQRLQKLLQHVETVSSTSF